MGTKTCVFISLQVIQEPCSHKVRNCYFGWIVTPTPYFVLKVDRMRLKEEVIEEHLRDDTDTIKEIFDLASIKKEVDIEAISAAFHAIYYATLHKGEIEVGQYDKALRMLIYGVVAQMI